MYDLNKFQFNQNEENEKEKLTEKLSTELFCDYCQIFEDTSEWSIKNERVQEAVAKYHNFMDDTFACKYCYEEERKHVKVIQDENNENLETKEKQGSDIISHS